jgi:hypothetical protein
MTSTKSECVRQNEKFAPKPLACRVVRTFGNDVPMRIQPDRAVNDGNRQEKQRAQRVVPPRW